MLDLKPNLSAYARVSYFRELDGDLDGAVEAMRLAVSAGGGAPRTSPTSRRCSAISSSSAGESVRRRLRATALRSLPGYPAGLVGLARADAAGGDLGEPPSACVAPPTGCR